MTVVSLGAGLGMLLVGAALLVKGASSLARTLGVRGITIGLTVVPLGTSAPEFLLGVKASGAGYPEIAVGDVVGSNTFNALFILGFLALVNPLRVSTRIVRIEVPIMIAVSVLLLVFSWDGVLSDREAGTFLTLLVAHLVYLSTVRAAGGGPNTGRIAVAGRPSTRVVQGGVEVLSGVGLLFLGASLVVSNVQGIATGLGLNEYSVGLMVVAAGTSLPELVTSLVAALRGERDLAVGNVVGSNIFNILAVLGISAMTTPNGLAVPAAAVGVDIPVMLAAALFCLIVSFTDGLVTRGEGAVLVLAYLAYAARVRLGVESLGLLPSLTEAGLFFSLAVVALVAARILGKGAWWVGEAAEERLDDATPSQGGTPETPPEDAQPSKDRSSLSP